MIDKLTIREYLSGDRDRLLEIFDLNTPDYFAFEERKDLENYLDNEIDRYFVVLLEDEIIGSGGLNYRDNLLTGLISWDLLHPDYKGKRVGSFLLNHRIKLLKEERVDKIYVRTSQLVYKFYEKLGFSLVTIRKDYWSPGFDLYEMEFKKENY